VGDGVTLEEFLALDEDGLRAFIEHRLRLLDEPELPAFGKARRELIEYGNELGAYMYRLDALEGLRLFALAAELERLDARDEVGDWAAQTAQLQALPEINRGDA
jgi:hypothetical protein